MLAILHRMIVNPLNIFVLSLLLLASLPLALFAQDAEQSTPDDGIAVTMPSTANIFNTREPKALLFPPLFQQSDSHQRGGEQSIRQLTNNIQSVKNEYLKTLRETTAFRGLYLNGGYAKNVESQSDEYFYGLEWELYDNGHYAAKRKLEKRQLETQLQFLQQLKQMYERRKHSQAYFIQQIEERVNLYIANLKSEIILPQYSKVQHQLKQRFITEVEFNEWRLRADRVKASLNYLPFRELSFVSPDLLSFLNKIDRVKLKAQKYLLKEARKNSHAIKIQKLLSARSEFLPTWKDNLSLSFFLEQRYNEVQGSDDVVGIRMRIPIGSDSNRSRIIQLDKNISRNQVAAVQLRLQQRLLTLKDQFTFYQDQVARLGREYRVFDQKIATLEIQKQAGFATLGHTPEKDIPFQQLLRIDVLHNALRTRLKIYSVLIELEELLMPNQIDDLLESP